LAGSDADGSDQAESDNEEPARRRSRRQPAAIPEGEE